MFEAIDGELIQLIAKDVSGSGGPSLVDAESLRHIICCNNFKAASEKLCQAISCMTKRLCTEDIEFSSVSHLMSCRLIPLMKEDDGIRPIGIGEVLRRIMAKSVARVLKRDITHTTGSLQTCSGIEGGIEASVHAMAKIFNDEDDCNTSRSR